MDVPWGHNNFVENNILQIFVTANLGLNFSFVLVNFGSQLFCKPFCLVFLSSCLLKYVEFQSLPYHAGFRKPLETKYRCGTDNNRNESVGWARTLGLSVYLCISVKACCIFYQSMQIKGQVLLSFINLSGGLFTCFMIISLFWAILIIQNFAHPF